MSDLFSYVRKERDQLVSLPRTFVTPFHLLSSQCHHYVQRICRYCFSNSDTRGNLVAPCLCSGSLKYIHYDCLIRWIIYGNKMKCEICNIPFKITEIRKPIYLWGITGVSKVSTKSCTLSGLVLMVSPVRDERTRTRLRT